VRKFELSLQWKFFLSIVLIIVPTLGIIFTWTAVQHEKQSMDQIKNEARVLSKQIILTRQWISDCGGIFVNLSSKGAQDTTCFVEDRLKTSRGLYQRFTPSMVTRKLSQYSRRQDLYRFRLASLNPLNPDNKPDKFEKEALEIFKKEGLTEMFRFARQDGIPYFQYTVPLYLEKRCIKCHHGQRDSPNAVRGGLSIFLPIGNMKHSVRQTHLKLAVSGTILILLTLLTLFTLMRRFVIRPLKDLEKITGEISRGNLEARVDINTGDEFEKLGKTFNYMAQRVSKARDSLEEKIAQATRDLSDANRELKTLDKLKSNFLANMSHELRSPLTVIRGGIDYLSRTIKIEDNRNYLNIIDKNLDRLINLVSDLFDFTKIEAKKIEWSLELVNLAELVQEVIEIINPLSVEKNIVINYQNPGDILVELDLERIEQVLVNLIDNAIKFSDPGTEIFIRVMEKQESATVAVTDQGIGISEENLETIFEKFSTVPSGSNSKTEGTGLGLAICKAIVEAHGGKIWAKSKPGESSTFYFTLPKKQTQPLDRSAIE
jgi:signal transduction histidine kinase